jgi:anti-sigma regulatory factor (Ser/Thr protein kinase)
MANQVVELLSSELLANAVLHGSDDESIRIEIACTDTVVRVSVTDNLPQRPVVLHPEPVAPAGRGMAIIEAMSNRWGVEPRTSGGKTVWFEIDLDEY